VINSAKNMVSWTTKHQRELQAKKRVRIDRYLKGPVWFFIGVIATLLLQNLFVRALPGPRTAATIQGSRYTRGSGLGCRIYDIRLQVDDPIDYSYFMLGFPANVQDYQAGIPYQFLTPDGTDFRASVFAAYRDASGKCLISPPKAINKDESVTASSAANSLYLHTTKLPRMSFVEAIVAVDEYHLGMKSDKPYFEGEYEYTKMGRLVRRKLDWKYLGLSDIK